MPEIKSYADLIRDWEKLLNSANARQDQLPNVEPFRESVQQVIAEAKEVKARQDAATADRQRATQELTEVINRGRDLVSRLRQAIRAVLGTKNEMLILFGVMPVRRRARKTPAAPVTPNPPAPRPTDPVNTTP